VNGGQEKSYQEKSYQKESDKKGSPKSYMLCSWPGKVFLKATPSLHEGGQAPSLRILACLSLRYSWFFPDTAKYIDIPKTRD